MNNLPLIGLGIATKSESGQTLDTFFPSIVFKGGEEKYDQCFDDWNALMSEDVIEVKDPLLLNLQDDDLSDSIDHLNDNQALILCRISDNKSIENTEEAYLKLHLISYKYFVPNSLNLENLFGHLVNVAWTNQGPIELEGIEKKILSAKKKNQLLEINSIDKFPCLTDYIIPPGVRIADSSRVRLGAYLSEGTTVMHEGFVNFNAGTLGPAMIEGRISAGVVVGKNSDLGGGCSTMGTLSGGNNIKISVGENCLLGANSGLGIPIGDNCIVEAGLYVTGGSKVTKYNAQNEPELVIKASELAGQDNLLFIRNSQNGAIEAKVNPKSIELNESLHKN
jgi:2,3,4,5-tetrahydropyridine-2-carboxylate N-succinyltransferase